MTDQNTQDQIPTHVTHEGVADEVITPEHAPRRDSAAFRKTRDFLLNVKHAGCAICGKGADELRTIGQALEVHHAVIEWSLVDAIDPLKVHADYPQVTDRPTLEAFLDSPVNVIALCPTHHRSPTKGIHHLTAPDFWAQKYLLDGYVLATDEAHKQADLATDEGIERKGDAG